MTQPDERTSITDSGRQPAEVMWSLVSSFNGHNEPCRV
jgi:hypothetical protein